MGCFFAQALEQLGAISVLIRLLCRNRNRYEKDKVAQLAHELSDGALGVADQVDDGREGELGILELDVLVIERCRSVLLEQ